MLNFKGNEKLPIFNAVFIFSTNVPNSYYEYKILIILPITQTDFFSGNFNFFTTVKFTAQKREKFNFTVKFKTRKYNLIN